MDDANRKQLKTYDDGRGGATAEWGAEITGMKENMRFLGHHCRRPKGGTADYRPRSIRVVHRNHRHCK